MPFVLSTISLTNRTEKCFRDNTFTMISSTTNRSSFILDLLPKEIVCTIFDFLWSHEILYTFLHISDYIDGILLRYPNYSVNFKSISKRHFDLVCHHVKPNQIKSLVLSDSNKTPGQSKIFLSLFPIEQFIYLRAISLFEIENNSRFLFSNIDQLKELVSFETDTLSNIWMIETIPCLKRLQVNQHPDTDYHYEHLLNSISFSHLRNLTLPYCSYTQLQRILRVAPKLTSLNISLFISDCTGIDYFAEQHQDTPLSIHHLTMSICTFSKFRYSSRNFYFFSLCCSNNITSSFRTISFSYASSSTSRTHRFFWRKC
jgi:hypothetical protein